jgi:hypothetical protein
MSSTKHVQVFTIYMTVHDERNIIRKKRNYLGLQILH